MNGQDLDGLVEVAVAVVKEEEEVVVGIVVLMLVALGMVGEGTEVAMIVVMREHQHMTPHGAYKYVRSMRPRLKNGGVGDECNKDVTPIVKRNRVSLRKSKSPTTTHSISQAVEYIREAPVESFVPLGYRRPSTEKTETPPPVHTFDFMGIFPI
ncbi:hypothetical protein RJ639_006767 [Escallonia herrerae]|uniref:Uncharacterized protein n=1 Tax=Escallonia herrerae TaxID=1293975 RepID=A0AA88W0Q8_9ASTE|nr:hypothetical protein RJ639_006767 [Escallonia herrerae]